MRIKLEASKSTKDAIRRAISLLTKDSCGSVIESDGKGYLDLVTCHCGVRLRDKIVGVVKSTGHDTKAVLPIDALKIIAKTKRDARVEINITDDYSMMISIDGRGFTLHGIDPEKYIDLSGKYDFRDLAIVSGKDITEAIKRSGIARGKDAMRYVFRGVLFEIEKEVINIVSTDAKIMTHARIDNIRPVENVDKLRFVIPEEALKYFKKAKSIDKPCRVAISTDGSAMRFKTGNSELIFKGIDARFPNWDKVFPSDDTITGRIDFPADDISDIVKRVDVNIKGKARQDVHIDLISCNINKLSIEHDDKEIGTFSSAIYGIYAEGDRRENIGSFSDFYMEKLTKIHAGMDSILEWQTKPETPIVIWSDNNGVNYRTVLMPLQN